MTTNPVDVSELILKIIGTAVKIKYQEADKLSIVQKITRLEIELNEAKKQLQTFSDQNEAYEHLSDQIENTGIDRDTIDEIVATHLNLLDSMFTASAKETTIKTSNESNQINKIVKVVDLVEPDKLIKTDSDQKIPTQNGEEANDIPDFIINPDEDDGIPAFLK